MRISLEIERVSAGEEPCEIEVHFDKEGLNVLIDRLNLIRDGKTDHVHMFTLN